MNLRSRDVYDRAYKRIHAMYMNDKTYEEMYQACSDLEKWEVMEIIQTIFGRDQQRRERYERDARY